ncbi:MAG TPA: MotA/TolQ/ExbB proton channel family protein, partial [Xanthomonadales bacterium]|nr:MotA/TolQ/ExbB proton channel family protein [Xanthomonadales bacterium]
RVLELIMAGGWAMVPILVCSVLVLAIVVERSWTLRRKAVLPPGLAEEVRTLALQRKLDAQHLDELERNSPLGAVLAGALAVRHLGRDAIRERVEDAGRHVMHDMDKFLATLGTIALISPLLGLLGTVFGLMEMFLSIMGHGIGDANHMAGGIGEALVCTAAGLTVAVPAYVFHRAFRARVTSYGIAMEKAVLRLLDELDQGPAVAQVPTRRAAR